MPGFITDTFPLACRQRQEELDRMPCFITSTHFSSACKKGKKEQGDVYGGAGVGLQHRKHGQLCPCVRFAERPTFCSQRDKECVRESLLCSCPPVCSVQVAGGVRLQHKDEFSFAECSRWRCSLLVRVEQGVSAEP